MRRFLTAVALVLGTSATAEGFSDPPALRGDKAYLTNVEVAVFNGPVADVIAALQTPETGVLAHVTNTDRIPAITAMENLQGDFPDAGAVRRLGFEDGSEVVEQVLENSEARFTYQVWGFTSANGRALSHIRGAFTYDAVSPMETRVTWTYQIAPRVFFVRPFVRSFLKNDFAPFMESGLQGAAATYNARVNG